MADIILYALRFVIVLLGLGAGIIGLLAAYRKFQTERKRRVLVDSEFSGRFLKQFNDKEISRALSGYVVPHCSPSDPANRDGEEHMPDMRESIFSYMDRSVESLSRTYHLLLADTGMGKTTFCLNYFSHIRRKFPNKKVCLISLASKDYEHIIRVYRINLKPCLLPMHLTKM